MIALAVTWVARPGHEEAVADLFRTLTAVSREEPGCLMYLVHRHQEEPHRFFIYEQYRDAAALDAHRAAPHFTRARPQLVAMADRVDGHLYDPLE